MILLDSVSIKEFRGVRDLTLDLKGKNFAVSGPNGSGKSGIVDALEFALTGDVSRLSGEGRGGVSVKQHAAHVDSRGDPAKACVSLRVTIPSLRKTVTIERNAKTPNAPKITPADKDVVEILDSVSEHPEFVLSRRELIRYVLATPGKRAEEVQALLHLDQVGRVRLCLQKLANDCEKQLRPLDEAAASARENLLRVLGVGRLDNEAVLTSANAQRSALGLRPLAELADKTSLKEGMAEPGPAQPQRIPRAQALADVEAARDALIAVGSDSTRRAAVEATPELKRLAEDPAVAASVKLESFYRTGFDLLDKGECPFCATAWDIEVLKKHVREKMDHLTDIARRRSEVEARYAPVGSALRSAASACTVLKRYAASTEPAFPMQALSDFSSRCVAHAEQLGRFVPLRDTVSSLATALTVPAEVSREIGEFEAYVSALPEPTSQEGAREWLAVAQERLEVWRGAMQRRKAGRDRATATRQISDIYGATSDAVLTSIFNAVEKDFASLYAFVNRDDEAKFSAKLTPSTGKLDFDVDFYGRGLFPPDAYHSEGHQDSMGLCLYLALMRYLQGERFTVAVLDDVLMSVDVEHRREICRLLKREFPKTQFIMTTHDPIWLRHMRTEGLIAARAAVQFRCWTVDEGPNCWDDRDIWTELSDLLKRNDVRAAAGLLRHYLEYTATELCHRLRAPVAFRGDAQYELGELLPPAITRLHGLYGKGKDSANSWNQKAAVKELATRAEEFSKRVEASHAEQWEINAAVHYNAWDNFVKGDFGPVVQAFHELVDAFACPDCGEYLRVSPDRETPECLRCECGKTNINLLKKPKSEQATAS